ncbi:hypothetical protein F2P81_001606 [Scophthalmus maximus]|uniref:Uncharacterized protein n=1 Tax=Scophthalmus maximus TaxID=52904 RepID=A0A6A4TEP0_SCOMX|nr:hypothetical protein F2P81_001606 [Scophthalmus maximus]
MCVNSVTGGTPRADTPSVHCSSMCTSIISAICPLTVTGPDWRLAPLCSVGFKEGPGAAALVQRLQLQATDFLLPNPTRYGRHTHSSFKQTKAAHNDQRCHYGRLI